MWRHSLDEEAISGIEHSIIFLWLFYRNTTGSPFRISGVTASLTLVFYSYLRDDLKMIMISVKVRISLIRVNPSDFLTSELHLRVLIVSILIWLARFMPLESWLYTMTIGWELYMEWGARKVTLSIENQKNVVISKWRCSEEVTRVLGKSHSEKSPFRITWIAWYQ